MISTHPFSEDYIQMCIKALEIHANWIPQLGDYIQYHEKRNLGNTVTIVLYFLDLSDKLTVYDGSAGKSGEYYDYTSVREVQRVVTTWLPRQDQIQDLLRCSPDTKLDSIRSFVDSFNDFVRNHHSNSLEELWLRYYMKTLHNKVWTTDGTWENPT